LEPGWVEEKIEEGKTRCDPVKNPIATRLLLFFFLLKRCRFNFFKKGIDLDDPIPGQNPVTRSKLRIRVLDWASHRAGSENYVYNPR
jgi:hypothetical protein